MVPDIETQGNHERVGEKLNKKNRESEKVAISTRRPPTTPKIRNPQSNKTLKEKKKIHPTPKQKRKNKSDSPLS
jgi:hypothetical protein